MCPAVKTILERVATWPEKDQEELADVAREIEARRTGVYLLDEEEQDAVPPRRPPHGDDTVAIVLGVVGGIVVVGAAVTLGVVFGLPSDAPSYQGSVSPFSIDIE